MWLRTWWDNLIETINENVSVCVRVTAFKDAEALINRTSRFAFKSILDTKESHPWAQQLQKD